MSIKQRVLTGWTWQRALYLVMGIVVIVQSIAEGQWPFAFFGAYFASMGLFAFGCAAGNCRVAPYSERPVREHKQ